MRWHKLGFAFSALLTLASIGLFVVVGLNYGIDFVGGTLMEVRVTPEPASARIAAKARYAASGRRLVAGVRSAPTDVLVRLPRQPGGGDAAGGESGRGGAGGAGLGRRLSPDRGRRPQRRRAELIRAGVTATALALVAIALYIGFRFEWQFGVGGMISTLHDVVTTVGIFALFHLEFDLTTLAAILTVAGYSGQRHRHHLRPGARRSMRRSHRACRSAT